jgi:hypothetical protein
MVDSSDLEEILRRYRTDLAGASKALIQAANRGGGEDNITAVAFRISADAAPSAEDTVAMPAITGDAAEPDEQTREYAGPGSTGDTMVVPPGQIEEPAELADSRRVRIVLIVLVLLLVAAALIVWGLLR